MKNIGPGKLKKDSDFADFAQQGIPSHFYDRHYYLSLSGPDGEERITRAVGSGVYRQLLGYRSFARAIELGELRSGYRILDVGCGRGELAFMLARQRFSVQGIDYSQDAIDLCCAFRQHLPVAQKKLVDFSRMDILSDQLPLKERAYDVVFFLDVIEHLTGDQGKKALQSIFRLLVPGGRLIVHTPNKYFEQVAYRALAVFYHGWRGFAPLGTRTIDEAKPYEYLHIHYYSRKSLHEVLLESGFSAKMMYVHPERIEEIHQYLSPGESLPRRLAPFLVYWLAKTPAIAFMSPSLWAVGTKRVA